MDELTDTQHRALESAMLELQATKDLLAAIQEQEKAQAAAVRDLLFEYGLTEFTVPDACKVAMSAKKTTTVVRELLIAGGVEIAKIEAATKTTVSAPFVVLTAVGLAKEAKAAAKLEKAEKAEKAGGA